MRASVALGWLAALVLVLLLPGTAVQAEQAEPRPFSELADEWNRRLDATERFARQRWQSPEGVAHYRSILVEVRKQAQSARTEAMPRIEALEDQAEALGPPPEEGKGTETAEVAEQRRVYAEALAVARAAVVQANLAITRATEYESLLSTLLRDQLVTTLLAGKPNPLLPSTFTVALPELGDWALEILRSPVTWWREEADAEARRLSALPFVLIVLVAVLVGWTARRLLLVPYGRNPLIAEPSYSRRLVAAVAESAARGIIPALMLFGIIVRVTGDSAHIGGLFADSVVALCFGLLVLVLAMALPRAVLTPELPGWRLLLIDPANGRTICRCIELLAIVFCVDIVLGIPFDHAPASDELISVYALISGGLDGAILILLVQTALWRPDPSMQPAPVQTEDGEAPPTRGGWLPIWTILRVLVRVLALAGIVTALLGYSALSFFIIQNLLVSAALVGSLFLLRGLLRELIGVALRSRLVVETLTLRHSTRQLVKFWIRALLDLVVVPTGLLAILPFWGVPWADVRLWIGEALSGFTVGGVSFSIADIAVGVLVFLVGLLITRVVQRGLLDHVLPQTRLDAGVRNSLSSGLGYVGLVIAATLAISAVGVDLSNIALIAGALSVGIGFGLQNVVNNFVSGLILLIERPVKVGDWVSIGGNEGFIKRINVRATELETFQRASVIIPNADLLSGAVTNWTHKDRYGRIEVEIGVAYGSDTEKVRDVLLECARAHERVLGWPEPFVLFQNFGASSLDFELRCHTDEALFRIRIASDLRYAIDERFRAEGIEIPFPQRVVHMADGPGG